MCLVATVERTVQFRDYDGSVEITCSLWCVYDS